MWIAYDNYEVVPTNELVWLPGPTMFSRRSGSAAVVFPTYVDEEKDPPIKPQLLVVGGLDENHNQASNSTELLPMEAAVQLAAAEDGAKFESEFLTAVRRGYTSMAIATVLGRSGRPETEEERKQKELEQKKKEQMREAKRKAEQLMADALNEP